MKHKARLFASLTLAVVLCATSAPSFTANAAKTAAPASGITYPIKGGGTLDYAVVMNSNQSTQMKSYAEMPMFQQMEKDTGVKINWIHPVDGNAMKLMFASGDLPDIVEFDFYATGSGGYPGGATKAISDGTIYPLDAKLQALAPDLVKTLMLDDDFYRSSVTADGKIVGFPFIRGDKILRISSGVIVRDDWVTELGLKLPQTGQQFYDMLKAFKEKKNATAPFSITRGNLETAIRNAGQFANMFGLIRVDYYVLDGKVHYGYYEPTYKNTLEYLNKLFADGLLDKNFVTLDTNTQNANMQNGIAGASWGALSGGIGNNMSAAVPKNPTYSNMGIQTLMPSEGQRSLMSNYESPVRGTMGVVTSKSKKKELATQWLNYGFTDKGHMLYNFGIEGISYTMKNGQPIYTDEVMNSKKYSSRQLAFAWYNRSSSNGPFRQDGRYITQYADSPQQKKTLEIWMNTDAEKYVMPAVQVRPADVSDEAKIMADVTTYVGEWFIKFVNGTEPLSKFETDYIPGLKKMNIEKAMEYRQNAYNDYMAK